MTTDDLENNISFDEKQKIFVEYATTTWCPQCPIASNTLYELYSNLSSFFYVTLVLDKNEAANQRERAFTNYVIPSVYFDGGYVQNIGNEEPLDIIYANKINECLQRSNRNNVQMNGTVNIVNNDTFQISLEITFLDQQFYFGKLRTYITEEKSRWNDNDGNPYHFSLIDFATDQIIQIKKGETVTIETEWDPNHTSSNELLSNISTDNIKIYSTISHWVPHFRTGFIQFPYIQLYFAHYIDEVLQLEP
jgi:hypothetical protein